MATKTTIWRPNVRVTLDEYGEVEDTESGGEEMTKQGMKRKRAPPTKGPCEHGVKYRSQCKVCGLSAREEALSVQGVRWCVNLRARSCTLLLQGVRWV